MRVLLVHDGRKWHLRHVRLIVHDLMLDEKVYRCDKHLGGPFNTLDEAITATKKLKGVHA